MTSEHSIRQATLPICEDVVISGIAGRFPEADSMEEFRENLINGVDMVTARRRWPEGLFGMPARAGLLKDISKFDATFFGVHPKQADSMDPQGRIVLETTYEAIVDAGVNPNSLRGKNVSVFVGCSNCDREKADGHADSTTAYDLLGSLRSMLSSRISYSFDFRGQSLTLDTACSSSLVALFEGLQAVRNGQSEAAIVAGVNLCLDPRCTAKLQTIGVLSVEGICKVFDENASGYVRSDGIGVVFLQKASQAKRIYCTVVNAKCNSDGFKEQGIIYPNGAIQRRLLEDVYSESDVNPNDIVYVEAHGTGTKAGDVQEVNNIAEFFCKERKKPLLIGSVKSNMGHAEAASGIASMAKLVLAMEYDIIPANLHYTSPSPEIPELTDGRLKVVAENTPFKGGLVAVCNYGLGGVNAHAILRPHPVDKHSRATVIIDGPKLFNFSGRTETSVNKVLTYMEEHANDHNLYALLSQPALTSIRDHPYRGYALLKNNPPVKEMLSSPRKDPAPVWFVYPGMGSQWVGMGRDLMKIEIFYDTIIRLNNIMKPYAIDIHNLIMESDESTFEDILNCFLCIACIQIALTNILKAVGIEPEGILGHSVGELGCSYADGCFTEEQMILAAYYRGYLVQQANLPPGAMAAVGMSLEEAIDICPAGVVPACHNSEDSVTVSGPAQLVKDFVKQLKADGKFVKEVNTAGIAFHSHYVSTVGPILKKALESVIPAPKQRTSRWISSSIPETRWNTPLAQTCSADYHANNLVSPVLFEEALNHVPKNALVIEISPHGLLHSLLKSTLGNKCTIFGLIDRKQTDHLSYLLSSLGKMYIHGLNLDASNLYPSVTYPVPRGTPMISSLIEWDHSQSWDVPTCDVFLKAGSGHGTDMTVEIDISSDKSKDYYLIGSQIDGRVIYPATGYLVLAWKALAQLKGKQYRSMPVVLEDVTLKRTIILPNSGTVKILVSVLAEENEFEISEGSSVVARGRIYEPEQQKLYYVDDVHIPEKFSNEYLQLKPNNIYKALHFLGYEYGNTFQGILESDNQGTCGKLKWDGNWVSYLDTILHFSFLGANDRNLYLPTHLQEVRINPELHEKAIVSSEQGFHVPTVMDRIINVHLSGGVEIRGLKTKLVRRRPLQEKPPVMEECRFVPFMEKCLNSGDHAKKKIDDYAKLCTGYIIHKTRELVSHGIAFLPNPGLFLDIAKTSNTFTRDDHAVEKYLSQPVVNATLLKVLYKIFSTKADCCFKIKVTDMLDQCKSELQEDSLLAALLDGRIIRTCLDIVLENLPSRKIKIIEASAVRGNLFPKIVALLRSQRLFQMDIIATDINPDKLSSSDLEMNEVKSSKWDFSSDVVQHFPGEANLVIGNGVLASNANNLNICLRNLKNSVKEGGFLLFLERTEDCLAVEFLEAFEYDKLLQVRRKVLLKAFESEGLELISEKNDGILSSLFLLRKITIMESDVSVITVEEGCYKKWVDNLKLQLKLLQETGVDRRLWVVAHDTATNGIIGMIKCLITEDGGSKIRCIFNPSLEPSKKQLFEIDPVKALKTIYSEIMIKDLTFNVYRNSVWGTFRHIQLNYDLKNTTVECNYSQVNILSRGDLSSIRWIESPLKYASKDEALCHVYYSAINFRDVLMASGKLTINALSGVQTLQDTATGLEFSGRDSTGRRVMGMVSSNALATAVTMNSVFTWHVPDNWALEEAATVPLAYTTVYYAFFIRGNLKKGETVLIHSGAGGIGQAAIAIALSHGCEVFTTVSSEEKRDHLKTLFPKLKNENFANSRDTSFEHGIMRATGGKGVDVVLNSLAEDKLMASVRLLAVRGRFLEIGNVDPSNNTPLGMEVFLKNIAFHGIVIDVLFQSDCPDNQVLAGMVSEGIKSGVVKPLCRTVFKKAQVEKAFSFMASGRNIGKVLLKIREEEFNESNVPVEPVPLKAKVMFHTSFHPERSYIITGGLGGVGLELCNWMVARGARKLVLSTRTGIRNGYQSYCIRRWKENGVHILLSTSNIITQDGAIDLLSDATKIGQVGGIFHLAMVLRDSFMEKQTVESFVSVCEPKASAAHNLDRASRKLGLSLDYFVVFSSVSCGYGNNGQANYGLANSVMERICELRQNDGLPGLAIQWGPFSDVGVFAETLGGSHDIAVAGAIPQRTDSCMAALDFFLNQKHSVVCCYILAHYQGSTGVNTGKSLNVIEMTANIMGIKHVTALRQDLTLGDLGIDSMMAVEIKNALERDFDILLSVPEIRQMSIKMLDSINSVKEDL